VVASHVCDHDGLNGVGKNEWPYAKVDQPTKQIILSYLQIFSKPYIEGIQFLGMTHDNIYTSFLKAML